MGAAEVGTIISWVGFSVALVLMSVIALSHRGLTHAEAIWLAATYAIGVFAGAITRTEIWLADEPEPVAVAGVLARTVTTAFAIGLVMHLRRWPAWFWKRYG